MRSSRADTVDLELLPNRSDTEATLGFSDVVMKVLIGLSRSLFQVGFYSHRRSDSWYISLASKVNVGTLPLAPNSPVAPGANSPFYCI